MRVQDGPWRDWQPSGQPTSVVIGVLDGVHRGHRELLRLLDESLLRTVLTFDPHPVEVLRPGTPPRLITTITERIHRLDDLGIGQVGVLDLAQIKDLEPERFIDEILVDRVEIAHMVVGEDFRFGHNRKGDTPMLVAAGERLGFGVDVVPLLEDAGSAISSSRIRTLIETGQLGAATRMLGSRFALTNTVVHGDKRGREIGFPTANLHPPARKVVPATGVYACFAHLEDVRLHAAVNVGVRPTFGGGELLIEAFLPGFDREIYGSQLTIEFVEYLRPELAFDKVEDLVERMEADVAEAERILAQTPSRI